MGKNELEAIESYITTLNFKIKLYTVKLGYNKLGYNELLQRASGYNEQNELNWLVSVILWVHFPRYNEQNPVIAYTIGLN